jgi:hypothetical protein
VLIGDATASPPLPTDTRLIEIGVHGEDVRRQLDIQHTYSDAYIGALIANFAGDRLSHTCSAETIGRNRHRDWGFGRILRLSAIVPPKTPQRCPRHLQGVAEDSKRRDVDLLTPRLSQ